MMSGCDEVALMLLCESNQACIASIASGGFRAAFLAFDLNLRVSEFNFATCREFSSSFSIDSGEGRFAKIVFNVRDYEQAMIDMRSECEDQRAGVNTRGAGDQSLALVISTVRAACELSPTGDDTFLQRDSCACQVREVAKRRTLAMIVVRLRVCLSHDAMVTRAAGVRQCSLRARADL
jgi:hypothetical protein